MAWGTDWYYNCSPRELWILTNKGLLQLFPRVWHRIYSDCSLIALRKYSQRLVSLWLGVQTGTITVPPGNSGFLLIKDYCNCSPRVWHRTHSDCSPIALRKLKSTLSVAMAWGIDWYYNCSPKELWSLTNKGLLQLFPEGTAQNT